MLSNNLIRISAAGSGKTWQICHDALKAAYAGERSLITTYTHKGLESIKDEICKQNAGILHENIDIFSWFQFLLSELIRPYQTTIFGINEVCGFDFSKTYGVINYHKTGTKKRYLNQSGQIRSNYASELALQIIKLSQGNPIRRLEKCYKFLFIDEIQDLAGYDIEILGLLLKTGLTVICAGDNKQATYKTHNAKKYKDKTGQNIWAFFKVVEDKGYARIERNLKSRRCNKFICSFANTVFSNENNISSIMDVKTGHDGVFLINKDDANKYWSVYSPQVLRYDIKTNVGAYIPLNFGQCKGMTFERVMIFPNKPLINFILKDETLKAPYKYYVAATRAKYSLAVILDNIENCSEKFVDDKIALEDDYINVKRFIYEE